MSTVSRMREFRLLHAVATLLSVAGTGCWMSRDGTTYNVYFLAGQSNMDGYGYVSELPTELNAPVPGVRIFHGNPAPDDSSGGGLGVWSELRPGHGVGFSSDGVTNSYSERFGVELTFALQLLELYPGANIDAGIAIIKYSRGGTSIDTAAAGSYGCWDPEYRMPDGINQYDHFLATVRNAMAVSDIDGDGRPDDLVPRAIVWMQGESDAAYTEEIAQRYLYNLRKLMGWIRTDLGVDKLKVVIGRISDSGQDEDGTVWDHMDIVRAAQETFALTWTYGIATVVQSTDAFAYSDPWHYDTEGYIDLGREFAYVAEFWPQFLVLDD